VTQEMSQDAIVFVRGTATRSLPVRDKPYRGGYGS